MKTLNEQVKDIINSALRQFNGNASRTAKALDISRTTVVKYMNKWERQEVIEDEEYRVTELPR